MNTRRRFLLLLSAVLLAALLAATAQKQKTLTFIDSWHEFPGPQVYRDAHTGTSYYVESDGRHVAAISRQGKLLWVRDPFTDAHLEPYRTDHAQIISIGQATWWGEGAPPQFRGWVILTCNSSQFGALNRHRRLPVPRPELARVPLSKLCLGGMSGGPSLQPPLEQRASRRNLKS